MSEHVPAWKRIGLKVKQELEADPLDITTHLDSGKVTAKQTKQLNKKKRAAQTNDSGEKKPPKRQKLPKSERPPPPEKDQLVYLKTYTTDNDNWKFSKQKQNWILKHIKTIEDKYEEYLVNYLVGLQGGSKDRLLECIKKVVESWNIAAVEEEKKVPETESKETEQKDDKKTEDKDTKENFESVDSDYAVRARKIVEALSGEHLKLIGIDDEEAKEDNSKIEKRKSSTAEKTNDRESTSQESESGSSSDDESKVPSQESEKAEEDPVKNIKESDTSNLIVEQVEVTDFLNDNDYIDPLPKTVQAKADVAEEDGAESEDTPATLISGEKKSKKEKKSKEKKKEKKEKKDRKSKSK